MWQGEEGKEVLPVRWVSISCNSLVGLVRTWKKDGHQSMVKEIGAYAGDLPLLLRIHPPPSPSALCSGLSKSSVTFPLWLGSVNKEVHAGARTVRSGTYPSSSLPVGWPWAGCVP